MWATCFPQLYPVLHSICLTSIENESSITANFEFPNSFPITRKQERQRACCCWLMTHLAPIFISIWQNAAIRYCFSGALLNAWAYVLDARTLFPCSDQLANNSASDWSGESRRSDGDDLWYLQRYHHSISDWTLQEMPAALSIIVFRGVKLINDTKSLACPCCSW